MTDKQLKMLKTIMFEKGISYEEAANALGISITAFSNKINGKTKFTVPEANLLSDFLELTKEQRLEIFLT